MESVGLAWIVRVTAGWGSPGVLEAMAKLLVTVRGGRSWAGPADPRGEELAPEGRSWPRRGGAKASKEDGWEGGQGGAGAGVWNAGSLRAQPQRRQVSGVPRPTLPGDLALLL